MRLIDADAFIEYLGLDAEDAREINLGEVVSLEDFDRQPVAYDVDKVVERLEECRRIMESPVVADCWEGECQSGDCTVCAFDKAVEIVKSGGIE